VTHDTCRNQCIATCTTCTAAHGCSSMTMCTSAAP
jgi:hypothetical protein